MDVAWAITQTDQIKRIFHRFSRAGFVDGDTAATVLRSSKLRLDQLAQIWDLADKDSDGKLDESEFVLAFQLCICVARRGLPVPTVMPDILEKWYKEQKSRKLPKFAKGDRVIHLRKSDGLKRPGVVVGVHDDDIVRGFYYTVRLATPDAQELQADEDRLFNEHDMKNLDLSGGTKRSFEGAGHFETLEPLSRNAAVHASVNDVDMTFGDFAGVEPVHENVSKPDTVSSFGDFSGVQTIVSQNVSVTENQDDGDDSFGEFTDGREHTAPQQIEQKQTEPKLFDDLMSFASASFTTPSTMHASSAQIEPEKSAIASQQTPQVTNESSQVSKTTEMNTFVQQPEQSSNVWSQLEMPISNFDFNADMNVPTNGKSSSHEPLSESFEGDDNKLPSENTAMVGDVSFNFTPTESLSPSFDIRPDGTIVTDSQQRSGFENTDLTKGLSGETSNQVINGLALSDVRETVDVSDRLIVNHAVSFAGLESQEAANSNEPNDEIVDSLSLKEDSQVKVAESGMHKLAYNDSEDPRYQVQAEKPDSGDDRTVPFTMFEEAVLSNEPEDDVSSSSNVKEVVLTKEDSGSHNVVCHDSEDPNYQVQSDEPNVPNMPNASRVVSFGEVVEVDMEDVISNRSHEEECVSMKEHDSHNPSNAHQFICHDSEDLREQVLNEADQSDHIEQEDKDKDVDERDSFGEFNEEPLALSGSEAVDSLQRMGSLSSYASAATEALRASQATQYSANKNQLIGDSLLSSPPEITGKIPFVFSELESANADESSPRRSEDALGNTGFDQVIPERRLGVAGPGIPNKVAFQFDDIPINNVVSQGITSEQDLEGFENQLAKAIPAEKTKQHAGFQDVISLSGESEDNSDSKDVVNASLKEQDGKFLSHYDTGFSQVECDNQGDSSSSDDESSETSAPIALPRSTEPHSLTSLSANNESPSMHANDVLTSNVVTQPVTLIGGNDVDIVPESHEIKVASDNNDAISSPFTSEEAKTTSNVIPIHGIDQISMHVLNDTGLDDQDNDFDDFSVVPAPLKSPGTVSVLSAPLALPRTNEPTPHTTVSLREPASISTSVTSLNDDIFGLSAAVSGMALKDNQSTESQTSTSIFGSRVSDTESELPIGEASTTVQAKSDSFENDDDFGDFVS